MAKRTFGSRFSHYSGSLASRLALGPEHLVMYVMGRFQAIRLFMVWLHGRRRPMDTQLSGSELDLVESVDVDYVVQCLKQDGFFAGLRLRDPVQEAIREFCEGTICYGDGNPGFGFRYSEKDEVEQRYGRRFTVARYFQVATTCPELAELGTDPVLVRMASQYLGGRPTLVATRIWWSSAGPTDTFQKIKNAQEFHYDIDGYRALCFFFYLTDVTPGSGAHICIRGSHRQKKLRHLLSLFKARNDKDIEETYAAEHHVVLSGSTGSGFAEDTFCFHKGLHPESADRLLLQFRFGLRDYGTPKDAVAEYGNVSLGAKGAQ